MSGIKRKGETYDDLWEDLMHYGVIDAEQVKSPEQFEEYVKEKDTKGKIPKLLIERLKETTKYEEALKETNKAYIDEMSTKIAEAETPEDLEKIREVIDYEYLPETITEIEKMIKEKESDLITADIIEKLGKAETFEEVDEIETYFDMYRKKIKPEDIKEIEKRIRLARMRIGRKIAMEERKEFYREKARKLKTAEELKGYGMSPKLATYKTLMSYFYLSEPEAKKIARRLKLRKPRR